MPLKLRRRVCFDPGDERMVSHPLVQQLLTRGREGVAGAGADAPRLDRQLGAEQAPERSPERRALGVAIIVRSYALPQRRRAWRLAVERRCLRRDANVQQRSTINAVARRSVDAGWRLVEVPSVDARPRRHRAWSARHVQCAVEAIMAKDEFDLLVHSIT